MLGTIPAGMDQPADFVLRSVAIGAGATVTIDLWALLLKRFGVPSLDFAHLGRWLGHLFDGQLRHESIARARPVKGGLWIGWFVHYSVGMTFAALLLAVTRLAWARNPTLFPALIVGIATVAAPLLVLQTALGAGIASSKTRRPLFNSVKSLLTHTLFGFRLYMAALASAWLIPA